MIDREAIAAYVRRIRHTAKFVAVTHSDDSIDPAAGLGEGFFTAHIYDEQINANLLTTKHGIILVDNTYIASFAFNLFLCWLGSHKEDLPTLSLDKLLAHNFKKFFAEQIYRKANLVPARALLLETLLYEQVMMVEVFAARDKNLSLASETKLATSLMTLTLTMHELGHYYLKHQPDLWHELMQNEPETVAKLYLRVVQNYDPNLVVEFQCDTYAVISCLRQFEQEAGAIFALRAIVFTFAAYAAMYSAAATADATGDLWSNGSEEEIDLLDISKKSDILHDIQWALDSDFLKRARLVQQLCALIAAQRGLDLFGDHNPFPLPSTIVDDLQKYVGRVFDCDDDNARKMSNLVAQSLYGHEAGMEYLYLRSKTFASNRAEALTLR